VQRCIRVLVIDLDPQANLTMIAAGESLRQGALGMADVLSPRAGEALADVTVAGIWENLEVAPAIEGPLAAVRDELVGSVTAFSAV